MLQQDEIDKFELLRDVAEHNAAFQNPEAVDQVRNARESSINIPDEEFEQTVKELFGREIDIDNMQGEKAHKISPLDIYDDLDEVEFIPFGE